MILRVTRVRKCYKPRVKYRRTSRITNSITADMSATAVFRARQIAKIDCVFASLKRFIQLSVKNVKVSSRTLRAQPSPSSQTPLPQVGMAQFPQS